MKIYNEIPAFILAGGKSTRMGQDKALLDLDGKPFIERIASTLDKLFTTITIITDQKEPYEFLKLHIQSDIIKESGPLGGIHAALVRSSAKHIFVISCDLPFVTAKLIERLADKRFDADVILPTDNKIAQPLCAVYSRASFPFVVKHLREKQYSVSRCLEDMKTLTVSTYNTVNKFGFSVINNINTPEDYERMCKMKD
ncbi:MAG: molybdenum cofactor guanylyltransferase [Bacteroidota bacterium]